MYTIFVTTKNMQGLFINDIQYFSPFCSLKPLGSYSTMQQKILKLNAVEM